MALYGLPGLSTLAAELEPSLGMVMSDGEDDFTCPLPPKRKTNWSAGSLSLGLRKGPGIEEGSGALESTEIVGSRSADAVWDNMAEVRGISEGSSFSLERHGITGSRSAMPGPASRPPASSKALTFVRSRPCSLGGPVNDPSKYCSLSSTRAASCASLIPTSLKTREAKRLSWDCFISKLKGPEPSRSVWDPSTSTSASSCISAAASRRSLISSASQPHPDSRRSASWARSPSVFTFKRDGGSQFDSLRPRLEGRVRDGG